jgi:hypothetical protein
VLQVVIIASANGWSGLMYDIIDAENFGAAVYFIVAVLVLNFWLINLFVAVITNSFAAIRADTKKSAFGAAPLARSVLVGGDDEEEEEGYVPVRRTNRIAEVYESIRWGWVLLAFAELVLQASRDVDMSDTHEQVIALGELVLTFVFDAEIIIRVVAELPDWRVFFLRPTNLLDLLLATGSSIIQIPAIRDSQAYPYLTVFQLARFYRVILEVPRMRPLMMSVFGNMYGLFNMLVFLLFVNALSALVAIQLLRPDLPADGQVSFLNLFNAFLGVYQVFSSENWTNVLYAAMTAELPRKQTFFIAVYMTIWMFFANCGYPSLLKPLLRHADHHLQSLCSRCLSP